MTYGVFNEGLIEKIFLNTLFLSQTNHAFRNRIM